VRQPDAARIDAAASGTAALMRLSPPLRMPTASPRRCRKSRSTSADAATEPRQACAGPMTALTATSSGREPTALMARTAAPTTSAPAARTARAPSRSASPPASGIMSVIAARRTVAASAKSLRVHPKAAVMGFMSTETASDDDECAATATTPISSAAHARQDSPSGPPAAGAGSSGRRAAAPPAAVTPSLRRASPSSRALHSSGRPRASRRAHRLAPAGGGR
jgi:hypothetical protein